MAEERKDFATTGEETFDLAGSNGQKESIILNIEEEKGDLIQLEKEKFRGKLTGNLIVDWFHSVNRWLVSHSRIKARDKATFFHLFSVMINSGVPMVQTLRSLALQSEKSPRMQMITESLAEDIEGGMSLSEALTKHDGVFTEQEIGMIQSGEASGQLAKVMDRLAIDAEKAHSIRSKIRGAMTYPVVVFMLLIGVIAAMMLFVVPRLTELFSSLGSELPFITRLVVGLSDFMVAYKLEMAGTLAALIGGGYLFKKTDMGVYFFDLLKLKLPVFGQIFQKGYLARFARSISNLIDSRVTFVRTLDITAQAIGNAVYRKKLILAREDVKQGIPLAESLTESKLFPPMLVNMIEVGEKTAQLDTMMGKVANFYEDEVDTAVASLSKLLEPLILVIIGGVVGTIVAAIMLPIMQLSDLTTAI